MPNSTANPFIVCFGELLIRLTATGGNLLESLSDLKPFVGGAEANVAVGLARLGQRTRMVSVVPDNDLGRGAVQELRRWGVDVTDVVSAPGRMGLYFLTPGAIHRPSDILYDRAHSAFATTKFNRLSWTKLLKGAGWLHISGITAALGPDALAAAIKAMQSAKSLGLSVSFDCNYRPKLWEAWGGNAPQALRALMNHADLIFGGYRDIELVFETSFPGDDGSAVRNRAAADHAFSEFHSLKYLVSTSRTQINVDHNRLAGLMFTRDLSLETKTYDVERIVDRIGGGDAFAAGVLHGLIQGIGAQQALDYGIACGCLKHGQPGDFGLATQADILGFLNEGGFDVRR